MKSCLHDQLNTFVSNFNFKNISKVASLALIPMGVMLCGGSTVNARPLNLAGSLTYGYGYGQSGVSKYESNRASFSLSGSSFLGRNWIGNLSAGLNVGWMQTDGNQSSSSSTLFTGGNLALALFPLSRFPFSLSYSVTHSDTGAEFNNQVLGNQFYTTKNLSVRQEYVSSSRNQYSLWYNRSTSESAIIDGIAISEGLGFRTSFYYPRHRFSFNGNYNSSTHPITKNTNSASSVTALHGYYPSTDLGVNTSLSYTLADFSSQAESKSNSLQGASTFSWRSAFRPYSLSGGVRFLRSERGDTSEESRALNSNMAIAYRLSRFTSTTVAINMGASDSGGLQVLSSTQSVSLSFAPDALLVKGFFYNWGIGSSLSNSITQTQQPDDPGGNQKDQVDQNKQTYTASFNHTARRAWNLSSSDTISLGFGQTMSGNKSSVDKDIISSMGQNISLNGQFGRGLGRTSMSLSLSDSRNLFGAKRSFQMITSQISRTQVINQLSSLSGGVYYQTAWNVSTLQGKTQSTRLESASANLNYNHLRVFGIYNLTYTSSLSSGDLLSDERRDNMDWNNNLGYKIGLLVLTMNLRVYKSPAHDQVIFGFSATRSF